ncbi:hypothetical protein QQF64_008542 [Cirrhinus molitorella]|uniref:Uncharacterized protein n=1 Tax=Cirrhinus molitorella TaxID=172907 RepID=A0ABR3M789_9TELE
MFIEVGCLYVQHFPVSVYLNLSSFIYPHITLLRHRWRAVACVNDVTASAPLEVSQLNASENVSSTSCALSTSLMVPVCSYVSCVCVVSIQSICVSCHKTPGAS